METTTAYKVVFEAEARRGLRSVTSTPFSREYKPRKWVSALVGGLFVFATREDALRFLLAYWRVLTLQLWECECEEPLPLPGHFLPCPRTLSIRDGEEYWAGLAKEYTSSIPIPEGTLVFKRVKLTKRIEDPLSLIAPYVPEKQT